MSDPSHFIDITLPVSASLPVWPGDVPVTVQRSVGVSVVSNLSLSSHTGTHVDAPAHFIPGGGTVDRIALDALVGPAWLTRVTGAAEITAAHLEHAGIPRQAERLLLATENSRTHGPPQVFNRDFVGLAQDAIEWLLARRFRLVGVDGPSVDPFTAESFDGHRALLAAGVVIVENLALFGVAPGSYRLICLPLLLERGDGAPARAILERI